MLLSLWAATLVHAQSPALLVLNKEDATLSIVDPASGKTRATVATGEGPHEVEVSSDKRLAFVSNYGARSPGNTLSVIDLGARKELRRVDLGDMRRPHGLSFSRGGLYFSSEVARSIGRYNPASNAVDWKFETAQDGTHMVLASRDGARLFTTNMGSNNVSLIERGMDERWTQTLIAVGAGPEALDESPNGREFWTAHSGDGGISIIDVASRKVIHTIDAKTKRSNRLKFTPDGKRVLVSDLGAGELLVFDAQTRQQRARVPLGKSPTGILVAPDGLRAFVAVSGDHHVAVIDLKSLTVASKIATGRSPDGMAWVP